MTLYQFEMFPDRSIEEIVEGFFRNKKNKFITSLKVRAREIVNLIDIIDKHIEKHSDYPLHMITPIDKSILRIAIFDIVYNKIHPNVAVSEAVKLALKFSSPSGYRFVNGVLSGFLREGIKNG